MGLSILPPGFQGTPEQTKAIDSSLNSVSSGIQAATQTSGPAEVSDWLETYSSSFPTLDPSLSGKAAFADSAAVQSPSSYLNMAKQLGGQNALTSFSDLVPMDRVATKLGDASFNHQKNLAGFSDALANLKLEEPATNKIPTEAESGIRRGDDPIESQAAIPFTGEAANKIPTESEGRKRTESEGRLRIGDPIESQAAVPCMDPTMCHQGNFGLPGEAEAKLLFIGDIGNPQFQDSAAVATLQGANRDSLIQEARVFDRLSDFRSTLQGIVSLNQDIQRK